MIIQTLDDHYTRLSQVRQTFYDENCYTTHPYARQRQRKTSPDAAVLA
jgi:hypothetical protein